MERFYNFQSFPGARITFGASDSEGRESSESIHFINVVARPMTGPYGQPTGEPVEISVALTVPQMAQIAKHFFWPLNRRGVFAGFLRRLLEKRWAIMTATTAKNPLWGEEEYRAMQYHRDI